MLAHGSSFTIVELGKLSHHPLSRNISLTTRYTNNYIGSTTKKHTYFTSNRQRQVVLTEKCHRVACTCRDEENFVRWLPFIGAEINLFNRLCHFSSSLSLSLFLSPSISFSPGSVFEKKSAERHYYIDRKFPHVTLSAKHSRYNALL